MKINLHLCQHIRAFLSDKKLCVTYQTPCRTSGHLIFQSYPCYFCGTTPRSGHQVQYQCYLRGAMLCQWSHSNLLRAYRFESVFYSQAFFTLCFFLPFKISLAVAVQRQTWQGFMLIFKTQPQLCLDQAIRKRFICRSFYLRAKASHGKASFMENQFCGNIHSL